MKKIKEKIIDILEDIYYSIWGMCSRIRDKFYEVKWFFQRGKRGYSDCDMWNLNDYLIIDILIPALTWLKENHHGCPPQLWDDKAKDQCHKWGKILEQMIEGFKAYVEMDSIVLNDTLNTKKYNLLMKKFKKAMKLFGKWFFCLWD